MRILITGATGFVGKTLIPFLYEHGYRDLCLVVRSQEKADRLFGTLKLSYVDCKSKDWTTQIISYNPDSVIHLATLFSGKNDSEMVEKIIDTNVLFTTLLLESLSHTDCLHFINAGTFTEFLYGNERYFANNLYSASKTAVRPIIRYYQTQSKWNWFNIIIYSSYGRKNEKKKIIDFLSEALDSPLPVKFTGGKQVLDFVHVDDMADFFCNLLDKISDLKKSYYQFHLGTGEGHTLREVGALLERISGKKLNAEWGGLPYRPLDTMYAVAPIARNLEILNWKSKISIENGIEIYLKDICNVKF